MFGKLLKHKMLISFLIIIAKFLPPSLTKPSEIAERVIVVAMGIDSAELIDGEMFEITVQAIRSAGAINQSAENLAVVSVTATEITAALDLIQLKLGKVAGFALCKLIVIGDTVAHNNLINILDYFVRSEMLGLNTLLINTSSRAKEIIQTSAELDNNSSFSIQRTMDFNMDHISSVNLSLGNFFKEYYCYGKSSVIPFIEMEKTPEEEAGTAGDTSTSGSSPAGGTSGGTTSSGGKTAAKMNATSGGTLINPDDLAKIAKTSEGTLSGGVQTSSLKIPAIINEGRSAIFKKGVKVAMLTPNQTRGFNWMRPARDDRGTITVKNVNGDGLVDATVTVRIVGKNARYKTFFEDGVPVYKAIINLDVKVLEIIQEDNSHDTFSSIKTFINEPLITALTNQIKLEANDVFNLMKENNYDILNMCRQFAKFNFKKWMNYLEPYKVGEEEYEGYLENIRLDIDVKIHSKY